MYPSPRGENPNPGRPQDRTLQESLTVRLFRVLAELVRNAAKVSFVLFKIMVPIIIVVKALQELGAIEHVAAPLGPVMEAIGLPASLGLAWLAAILSSIYAGIAVFYTLSAGGLSLDVGQVTVFGVLLLFAHNLLVEGQVTKRCGASFWGQNALRVFGGLACAFLLHRIFVAGGIFSGPARMLLAPPEPQATLWGWALGEAWGLCKIFFIILGLMALMRLLGALGVTRLLERILTPFLRLMGIGPAAATLTVAGMVMGLVYGSGLIIHETQTGQVPKKDVFAAVSLMSLSHALIEDTTLVGLMGASLWGSLFARLVFSLVAVAGLSRIVAWRARRKV